MKEYRLLPIFLVLLMTACTAAPTPSPSPASTVTLTPPPTATLTPTTATGTATSTEEPTKTPQPTPTPRYVAPPGLNQIMGLPPGAIARLGRGQFNDVDLSEDGAYLSVASSVGLAVYDALTFQELWFESFQNGMKLVSISPDNTMIAGAGAGKLSIWDLTTGEKLQTFDDIDGNVHSVTWSPDSEQIFAGSSFGNPYVYIPTGEFPEGPYKTMLIWDVKSGDIVHNLKIDDEATLFGMELFEGYDPDYYHLPILESEWSADGKYLVVGVAYEGYGAHNEFFSGLLIIVWDADSGKEVNYFEWSTPATANGEEAAKDRLSIHLGQNILAASSDHSLLIVDLETGQPIEGLFEMGEELSITGVGWSPDGTQLLTASNEVFNEPPLWLTRSDTLRAWDVKTGENIEVFSRADLAPDTFAPLLDDFEWSPSGLEIAAAYVDSRVIIWDAATGEIQLSIESVGDQIRWLSGGEELLSISVTAVQVWDAETGKLQRSLEADHVFQDVAWSPDGQTVVISSDSAQFRPSALVELWAPSANQPGLILSSDNPETGHIFRRVVFSPDGRYLAAGEGPYRSSGDVYVWDVATGERLFEEPLAKKGIHVWDVAWSPDQTFLAIADENWTRLLDTQTGKYTKALIGIGYTLAWSPDSKTIAAWKPDEVVHLVDIDSLETILELGQTGYTANSIAWSPDGTRIAVGTGNDIFYDDIGGITYIFDITTGKQLAVLVLQPHLAR